MSPPNGLLTSGFPKHDVGIYPRIIASDPFPSDDCLDVFSPGFLFLPPEPEELNTMNSSEDEPSSGLNGRLRPRKSTIPSLSRSITQIVRKLDGKPSQERPKRSSTPSKASSSKPEDLSDKPNPLRTPQLLCPYCDRKFISKQSLSKHFRRIHLSSNKHDTSLVCLFCNHIETEPNEIIRHMVDSHPNQYFACLDCHTRFPSTKELAEHKLNVCEKQKIPYRSKLRQKSMKKSLKSLESNDKDYRNGKNFSEHGFNGIVISCELKPSSHDHDEADIEDNITTNLILPPNKNLTHRSVLDKNAVIILDDIQWNRRIPSNFSFHNTDADQILSRLGVVHRSPKTGESTKRDWFKAIEDATQKFEKCFDTTFYSKVASNSQENLAKFLDGSFNFNPDPDNTIKTRRSKNSVVINTAEGFPILLASEQYSRNALDGYMPRTIAPKHKWKWDNLENEKHWNADQIKRDTHANNCIITLVSRLDIWTQLCMRRKFEDKFNISPIEKKTEKQNIIGRELKEILESREIPSAKSFNVNKLKEPITVLNERDFPTSLGLMPSVSKFDMKPAVLSGEWVRPRCYVCCACGEQAGDSRALSVHFLSQHPNAQVQHYEIVGESLLKADILKHLYVPPNHNINRTRPPRGFRDCTKCNKSITIEELHQHMLDCAGDTPTVRRKCRYRPFGVRRRRSRLPDNRIRKKIRNVIRSRSTRQKNRMRSRQKIRSEVGDAETIRKMIADLPAKRHRVLVNPLNSMLRPRRKLDKQRAMLMMKRRTSEDPKIGKPRKSNNALNYDLSRNSDKIMTSRDDGDSKSIRSRRTRMTCKITRQKPPLKRKTLHSQSTRKVMTLFEKKNKDDNEKDGNGKDGNGKDRNGKDGNGKDGNEKDGNEKDGNEKDGNEKDEKEKDKHEKDENLKGENVKGENEKDENEKDENEKDENIKDENIKDENKKDENKKDENEKDENEIPSIDPKKIQIDEISVNYNENRIDLNGDSNNIREHSPGRRGSNNEQRDNRRQQPSDSGQNGNVPNFGPPTQNVVPLKHSIASLTADCENHDKSIQFHQMFLVSQDGNNINRHVPSDQRVRFENEAIVTKLDKPPLHFNHLESIQGHSLESMQGHRLDPTQAYCVDPTRKHHLDSILGYDLEAIQRHNVDSVQRHNIMNSIQGHNLVAVQGYNLEPFQGHNSVRGQKLDSIQGTTLEIQEQTRPVVRSDIQGQIFDSNKKRKFFKPKKDLNHCITMLKTKLVDPRTCTLPRASAQSGTEDLISIDPVLAPTFISGITNEMKLKSGQKYPRTAQKSKKPSLRSTTTSRHSISRRPHVKPDLHLNIPVEREALQWRPLDYDAIMPQYIDNSNRGVSRRRSVPQTENIMLSQHLLSAPLNRDVFMNLPPISYDAYNFPAHSSSKTRQRKAKRPNNDLAKPKTIEIEINTEPLKASQEHFKSRTEKGSKSLDNRDKYMRTRTDTSRKSVDTCEKNIAKYNERAKPNDHAAKSRRKTLECQTQPDFTYKRLEGADKTYYAQIVKNQEKMTSNQNTDVHLTQLKQAVPVIDGIEINQRKAVKFQTQLEFPYKHLEEGCNTNYSQILRKLEQQKSNLNTDIVSQFTQAEYPNDSSVMNRRKTLEFKANSKLNDNGLEERNNSNYLQVRREQESKSNKPNIDFNKTQFNNVESNIIPYEKTQREVGECQAYLDQTYRSLDGGNTANSQIVRHRGLRSCDLHIDNNISSDRAHVAPTNQTSEINLKLVKEFEMSKDGNFVNRQVKSRKQHITSNQNHDAMMEQYRQAEQRYLNIGRNEQMYASHHFPTNNIFIRPAHANNVEALVPAPLNLSGKSIPIITSRCDAKSDDVYTLDLSNKSKIVSEPLNDSSPDVVVDLRINHSKEFFVTPNTEASLPSHQDLDIESALNLDQQNMYIPTDLSLKRRDKEETLGEIQDLSTKQNDDNQCQLNSQEEGPTDLSHKTDIDIEQSTSSAIVVSELKDDVLSDSYITYENINNIVKQDDSFEEDNDEKLADCETAILKNETRVTSEHFEQNLCESNNDKDNVYGPGTSQPYAIESSPGYLQRAVYDHTLRIPQFKINPAETSHSTNIGTCNEIYYQSQTSVTSDYRSQSSTLINSSMIASIESQERITYSFTHSLNVPVSTSSESLSIYLNEGMQVPCTSLDNTMPTLSTPSSSMSLINVDIATTTTLTNCLLSIPNKTIASTTPVYTLAGKTINYGTISNSGHSIPFPAPCSALDTYPMPHYGPSTSTNTFQEGMSNENDFVIEDFIFILDQDLEDTIRKILPEEIVELLETIPFECRCKLWTILKKEIISRPLPLESPPTSQADNAGPCMLLMPIRPPEEAGEDAPDAESADIKPLLLPENIEESLQQHNENDNLRSIQNSPSEPFAVNVLFQNQVDDLSDDVNVQENDDINMNDDIINDNSMQQDNINDDPLQFHNINVNKSHDENSNDVIMNDDNKIDVEMQDDDVKYDTENIKKDSDGVSDDITKQDNMNNDEYMNIDIINDCNLNKDNSNVANVCYNNNVNNDNTLDEKVNDDSTINNNINDDILIRDKHNTTQSPEEQVAKFNTANIDVPKTNTETTASLRAVRIKTPSERLKASDQPPKISRGNVLKVFEKEGNDTESLHINIIRPLMSEPTVFQRSHNSTITTSPQITVPSLITNYSVNNNLMQTKSLISTENNLRPIQKPNDNLVSPPLLSINHPECNEMKYVLNMTENKNKSCNKIQNDTISNLNDISRQCAALSTELPIKPRRRSQEDDDSDDDVSLAVIVKQKQQNQLKLKSELLFTNTKPENNSGKNPMDKTLILETSKSTDVSENITKRTENGVLINEISENYHFRPSDMDNPTDELNHETDLKNNCFKKKGKKCRRNKISAKEVVTDSKRETNINIHETDKNKENEKILEANNLQINKKSTKSNFMTTHGITTLSSKKVEFQDDKNSLTNKNCSSNIYSEDLSVEQSTSDFNDNDDVSKKVVNKQSTDTVNIYDNIHDPEKSLNSLSCTQENVIDDESLIYSNNMLGSELRSLQANNVSFSSKPCNVLNSDVNNSFDKINKNTENFSTSSIDAESGQPLRRSSHGQSLSMDDNEQANGSSSDTFLEHRTPLTKKQLIFSKLLLDEEKYIKTLTGKKQVSKEKNSLASIGSESSKTILHENLLIDQHNNVGNCLLSDEESFNKCKSQNIADDSNRNTLEDNILEGKEKVYLACENKIASNIKSQNKQDDYRTEKIDDVCQPLESKIPEKRKITSVTIDLDKNPSSKPKKARINDSENAFTSTFEVETVLTYDNNDVTNHNLPAARRNRSKSVVVKPSGSILYDPYDIELEDMAAITEPFRKQRLSQIKSDNSKKISTENVVTENTVETAEVTKKSKLTKTIITSDSDESSQSDEPLKKYVEEKERKHSTINVDSKIYSDKTNLKQIKRKHKINKRIVAVNDDNKITDTQEESQERIRSEQFMESFGFFSERKPRKSNLLATKKISETFHIIANDSDDVYYETKHRSSKKSSRNEQRKLVEDKNKWKPFKYLDYDNIPTTSLKKELLDAASRYCHVCKKEFRRTDNLLRHQMTLLHVSNLCEYEMNVRTAIVPDEPNYLVVFRQHMERLKVLQNKMKKSKKHPKSKFTLPSMQEILADVHKTVKEQQLARRSLSRDEALFIDCCELLKDSNRTQPGSRNLRRPVLTCCPDSYALACASVATYGIHGECLPTTSSDDSYAAIRASLSKQPVIHTSAHPSGMQNFVPVSKRQPCNVEPFEQPSTSSSNQQCFSLNKLTEENSDNRIVKRNTDDKCDSKSDGDVDSITAQNILNSEEVRNLENDLISGLKEAACKFQPIISENKILPENVQDNVVNFNSNKIDKTTDNTVLKENKLAETKAKRHLDIIENVDVFEDKFDKIKRKCRSQAAAAKQVQAVVEPSISYKSRKKSEKKKGKKKEKERKISKKNYQNTVLTKGALKGYDGIKVSILTSDINMSAINPTVSTLRKKKRSSSKKKKEKKHITFKNDVHRTKESVQKNVDVYEFMDNEEPEIFGLRPSTVMERFRKLNNKEISTPSKIEPLREEVESNDSVSDGDDFVYMSDAYVCDDESNEDKKSPVPSKKKEITEKNAVMGRIFKNNAFRSEKKSFEPEKSPKPTANLDQLFDSLLEDEPNSSELINSSISPKRDSYVQQKRQVFSPIELSKYDLNPSKNNDLSAKKLRTPSPALSSDTIVSKINCSFSSRESSPRRLSRSRYDAASPFDFDKSKIYDRYQKDYSKPKTYDTMFGKKHDSAKQKNSSTIYDLPMSPSSDELSYNSYMKFKSTKDRSPITKEKVTYTRYDDKSEYYDQDALSDDAGVARQRARRKCTVGKQNVLAETWSSESEPDGIPPRPNSAESVVMSVSRKKKGKKKEGHVGGGRKGSKQVSTKKIDIERRVSSGYHKFAANKIGTEPGRSGGGVSAHSHSLSLPGPSGVAPRPRHTSSFWADGDEAQEHVQQHGWIVGDSHKKLVTMLAHAKGRKRKSDDKNDVVE